MVASTRLLVVDPLNAVGYNLGLPKILIFQAHPMDAESYLNLGNSEATLTIEFFIFGSS